MGAVVREPVFIPGVGERAVAYVHSQGVPSNTWVITHNLNFKPGGIVVLDSGGTQIEGDVEYNSLNQLTLRFDVGGFSGTAYLS